MPSYDQQRLDADDPTYAPGIKQERNHVVWKAAPRYVKAGYKANRQILTGTDAQIAAQCRMHTRALMAWWTEQDVPKIRMGTFAWIIKRYMTDEFSPFQDVKANTQSGYREDLTYWEAAIGDVRIADMDQPEIKRTQKAMQAKGRSVDFIHRKFNCLRRVARYGKSIKNMDCRELAEVLSEMRFPMPQARDVAPTRAQIMAVVAAADAQGRPAFALGLLLQWWLALRAMDVRGDFFRMRPGEVAGGITRGKFRWADGLTWAEVSPDLMSITKVISKTSRHDARPVRFDLTHLNDVRDRLSAITSRVGPVILHEATGLPYDRFLWRKTWREMARIAGVPDNVQVRDARAGAVTEAASLGATPEMTRNQAGHSNAATNERYIRNRAEQIGQVIALRTGT